MMTAVRRPLLLILFTPLVAAAQAPDFSRAAWTSPVEFTSVASIRELSDGRLIVPDPGEREIRFLDARGTLIGTIGRRGGGPQEFQLPLWALAMPGDTTLVNDRDQERFLVIGPDGTPLRTIPWPRVDGGGLRGKVAADGAGHLIFTQDGVPRPGVTTTSLLRWDPGTGRIDSLTRVRAQGVVRYSRTIEGHEAFVTRALPFAEGESWAAGGDGAIVVIDPDRYVVRWLRPDGRTVEGAPISFAPALVTAADREYFLDGEDATTQSQLRFPDRKPAIRAFLTMVAPSGEAWTSRYGTRGAATRTWDVIDRTGRRLRTVELSSDRAIIGFGARTVYVIRTDEDGIQHLEAYR